VEIVLFPFAQVMAYSGEVADIVRVALDGGQPRVTLAESRRTVRTIAALYGSARAGRPATL
jgi:predicted dehydrogenase